MCSGRQAQLGCRFTDLAALPLLSCGHFVRVKLVVSLPWLKTESAHPWQRCFRSGWRGTNTVRVHNSPRAREKQQPRAQPCDQPFAVLEGTSRLGFDAGLLGRAVF